MFLRPVLASLVLAAALPGIGHAAGQVQVNFVDTQKFTDIGFGTVDRERVLKALGGFLQKLGEQQLPDGQTLTIDVTNVNLAGDLKFTPRGDVRVMRGRADWPEIELRYTLKAGEQTLKSGEAKVYDMAYLMTRRTSEIDTELVYEKRMLRRWFAETFAAH